MRLKTDSKEPGVAHCQACIVSAIAGVVSWDVVVGTGDVAMRRSLSCAG